MIGWGLLLAASACSDRSTTPDPAAHAPWIALDGGTVVMGAANAFHADEHPVHTVRISPLQIQATLVTVARFRAYVAETGAITSAERLGFGMTAELGMDDWAWRRQDGATWRAPWGPDAPNPQADDHPVVMVSWTDADAYCRHYGWRLPTDAEWTYAMRAGTAEIRYPWGDDPHLPDGRLGLNYWQGASHHENTLEDGYLYTSPVRAYPPNAWGIYDPAGNVWQWTADWYAADTYAAHGTDAADPQGPDTGRQRVARGGSWWCSPGACAAFGLHARGKTQPDAPYPNNGFRCVRGLPDAEHP